jgi:hypothetical protein
MSEAPECIPTLFDTRILYVVLQGEFAVYTEIADNCCDNDHLWIVAPEITGHVYKAGPWVTECGQPTDWRSVPEINCHELKLKRAVGDAKCAVDWRHRSGSIPEENVDTFMGVWEQNPACDLRERRARARASARLCIRVPMPLAILPGLIQTSESVFVQVKEQNGSYTYPPIPHNPAVIQILVYKWYKGRRPYLSGGTPGSATRIESGGPKRYQSIQIYASGEYEEQEHGENGENGENRKKHAQEAFHKAAELLGVNADVDWMQHRPKWDPSNNSSEMCQPKAAVPPPGLSWHQINSFLHEVVKVWGEENRRQELLYDTSIIHLGASGSGDRGGVGVSGSGDCGPITGGGGGG